MPRRVESAESREPYRLVATRGAALAAGSVDGVGDEAVPGAALGGVIAGGLVARVAVRVHRRLLDAVPSTAAAGASSPRRLAAGVAVVRRAGVGVGRLRRRRGPPGVGAVGRRRDDGEGLRVLGGVVGVDHLAALALARVLEVERIRHIAVPVPVAELGDVRLVLLLHCNCKPREEDSVISGHAFFLHEI